MFGNESGLKVVHMMCFKKLHILVSLQDCGEFTVKICVRLIHSGCGCHGQTYVTSSVAGINLHLNW